MPPCWCAVCMPQALVVTVHLKTALNVTPLLDQFSFCIRARQVRALVRQAQGSYAVRQPSPSRVGYEGHVVSGDWYHEVPPMKGELIRQAHAARVEFEGPSET